MTDTRLGRTIDTALGAMRVADAILHDTGVVRKGTGRYDAKLIKRVNRRTYEAVVHADGYEDQSYVRVRVWHEGWQEVTRFDGYELAIANPHTKGDLKAENVVPAQLRAAIDKAYEIVEGRS